MGLLRIGRTVMTRIRHPDGMICMKQDRGSGRKDQHKRHGSSDGKEFFDREISEPGFRMAPAKKGQKP